MKPIYSVPLSFVLAICLSFVCAEQLKAAPLKFTPSAAGNVGDIVCIVPVQKIGNYYPSNGLATIMGNVINIQAVQNYGDDPSAVLSGEVFDSECDTTKAPLVVTGLVYFNQGAVLNKMDNPNGDELVFARQGSVTGKIQQINKSYVIVQRKDGMLIQVDRNLVILIRSPRAYRFSMAATVNGAVKLPIQADVQSIEFKPTLVKAALPSGSVIPHPVDEDGDDL